jgi:predicted RNase H-like HicB family nuclease
MSEIIFIVENSDEGGYIARALGYSIYTEGETLDELKENIKDAVKCHFDEKERPRIARLHMVKDEVMVL